MSRAPTRRRLGGSMGGFLKPDELQREMAALTDRYPRWVSRPMRVGTSRQGRAIEIWCITANQQECSPGSSSLPTVFFTALVHAREPQTLACLLKVVSSVLEKATANDPLMLHMLSRRKMIIMPNANPDGYAWNAASSPNGGGMRRKNGLKTCTSSGSSANDGVDLNRNFGYKWAYDNIGSSSRGCSEEFRGAGPFSEPETSAIKLVAADHSPSAILHWHGWGNDLAFPYSYDWKAQLGVDELSLFQEFAMEMTTRNHYASGRAWESVGYTTNGEADDWGWGAERIASFTIEVGSSSDGFWPRPNRIDPIAAESVWPAVYLWTAVGPQLQIDTISFVHTPNPNSHVQLHIQNNGLGDFTNAHACCIRTTSPGVVLHGGNGWKSNRLGQACSTIKPLKSREVTVLSAFTIEWQTSVQWLELEAGFEEVAASSSLVSSYKLHISVAPKTRSDCDDLCMCSQTDAHVVTYSHDCKSKTKVGSSCRIPKSASLGTNMASGVDDEYYVYQASQFSSGGICKVGSSKRDTLIAVYGSCNRVGAQQPLAFSNSEGHLAQVEFPCQAGSKYYLFWNAEYIPGAHTFSISERCGTGNCVHKNRTRQRTLRSRFA